MDLFPRNVKELAKDSASERCGFPKPSGDGRQDVPARTGQRNLLRKEGAWQSRWPQGTRTHECGKKKQPRSRLSKRVASFQRLGGTWAHGPGTEKGAREELGGLELMGCRLLSQRRTGPVTGCRGKRGQGNAAGVPCHKEAQEGDLNMVEHQGGSGQAGPSAVWETRAETRERSPGMSRGTAGKVLSRLGDLGWKAA